MAKLLTAFESFPILDQELSEQEMYRKGFELLLESGFTSDEIKTLDNDDPINFYASHEYLNGRAKDKISNILYKESAETTDKVAVYAYIYESFEDAKLRESSEQESFRDILDEPIEYMGEMATWSENKYGVIIREPGMRPKQLTLKQWESRWNELNRSIVGVTTLDGISLVRARGHAVAGMIMRETGPKDIANILKTIPGTDDPEDGKKRYEADGIRIVVGIDNGYLITIVKL